MTDYLPESVERLLVASEKLTEEYTKSIDRQALLKQFLVDLRDGCTRIDFQCKPIPEPWNHFIDCMIAALEGRSL